MNLQVQVFLHGVVKGPPRLNTAVQCIAYRDVYSEVDSEVYYHTL